MKYTPIIYHHHGSDDPKFALAFFIVVSALTTLMFLIGYIKGWLDEGYRPSWDVNFLSFAGAISFLVAHGIGLLFLLCLLVYSLL